MIRTLSFKPRVTNGNFKVTYGKSNAIIFDRNILSAIVKNLFIFKLESL